MGRNYNQDREYNQLLSEYQRLRANLESLNECLIQKTEQWEKKQGYYDNLEKHSRMLCEEILAKDSSEMRLGCEYSWSKVDAIELIDKAIQSYGNYNKSRTDLMIKISNISEERLVMIKALEDEVIYYKQKNLGDLTEEEVNEMAEQEKNKATTSKANTERNDISYIVEEDADFDETDEQTINSVTHTNESYRDNNKHQIKTKCGREYTKSNKRVEYEKQATKNEVISTTVGLEELRNKIQEVGWAIIKIIGQTGVSERQKINKLVIAELGGDISESKINIALKSLVGLGILYERTLGLPLHPKFCIHTLTSTGAKVYKSQYGQMPTLSEYDTIIKEHDNADHGYGIKELLELLKNKKIYTNLTMDRKKCRIQIKGVGEYIPDITGKYNNMPVYFEYERGTHTEKDFETKLEKLLHLTKIVNIVVPNTEIAVNNINPKIEQFIKKKGKVILKNTIFRVSAMRTINNEALELINNEDWQYVFDVNKMNL